MKLLIIGIDPGTTAAYAVLDLEGNLIKSNSAKEFSLPSMISEIIKLGKPIITGTDVSPAPSFVEDFAIKTGSKLIDPEKDLTTNEKKALKANIKTKNIHESDALASALYALKVIKPLLDKTDKVLKKEKKQEKADQVKELVIKHDIAIKTALDILEKPEKEAKIIKKVIEKKIFLEKDFINLYEKLKAANKDIKLLKLQNQRLEKEAELAKRKFQFMLLKLGKYVPRDKVKQATFFKDKTIKNLKKELAIEDTELKNIKKQIDNLNKFIIESKDKTLLKKLDNLTYLEFKNKNKILNIQKGDILLIDDLNTYSQKTIDELKNKVSLIIFKKASKKTRDLIPITTIKNLKITETEFFAAVDKEALNKEKSKADILGKVVEDYKKKRA